MSILDSAQQRYATKSFNPNKKISPQDIQQLKEIVRLTPSSVNIQPWHIILTDSQIGKTKIIESMKGNHEYNQLKIQNASHIMVLCIKTNLNQQHLDKILNKEIQDKRITDEITKQQISNTRKSFFAKHNLDSNHLIQWETNQTFIMLGNLLLAAAAMNIDAIPLEGFDKELLIQSLNLTTQHLSPVIIVPLGYHAEDDFNFKLPKSRLNIEDIFTEI